MRFMIIIKSCPTLRGRGHTRSPQGKRIVDGPFAEAKGLIELDEFPPSQALYKFKQMEAIQKA